MYCVFGHKSQFFFASALVLLIIGLTYTIFNAQPSMDILDFAKHGIQNSVLCENRECRDFKFRANELSLSRANKAIGIDERWCIKVEFLIVRDDGSIDQHVTDIGITVSNEMEAVYNYGCVWLYAR